jgi:predicted neuraminidase
MRTLMPSAVVLAVVSAAVSPGAVSAQPGPAAPAGPEFIEKDGLTKIRLLPPGPGNPRNSEGAFLPLKDGGLLFVYTRFTGGTADHASAVLAARRSADGGRTWTDRDEIVVDGSEAKQNVMSVSLLRMADGRIGLFYLRKNALSDCRLFLRTSADEGKTWGEPTPCIPQEGCFVVNNDRVIRLKSGRLVVPAAKHGTTGNRLLPASALCFLSDDDGKTWRAGATELPPIPKSGSGLQEPLAVELKDGRLMMLCRTDRGAHYRSFSPDGGETWSPAEPSELKSPLSPASIKRIPKTGDLLLVWNDHREIDSKFRGKRTPLHVAVSRDEGQTWEKVRTLEDDPDGWYCYTAIEFVGDRVVLGHCAGGKGVGHLNRTQITLFDLDWLYR